MRVATLEVGRVCMKTAGREAGKYAVVLKKLDDNFVLITGPKILTGVKRRRCNIEHLEPTPYTLKIKEEASDKEVLNAYEKAGLLTKLGLRKPSPEIVKEAEKVEKKEEVKKEEKKVGKPREKEKPKKKEKKVEKKEVKKKKPEKKEKKEGIKIKLKVPSLKKKEKSKKKTKKK